MPLIADNIMPFFRVVISAGHNNTDFFRPVRAQLQNPLINLHCNRAGICHNHRFACKQTFTVILVMVKNIADQRVYGVVVAQYGFHLSQCFLALFNNLRICIVRHDFILGINHAQRSFIQVELNDTAFVINRAGCTIFNSLRHIINVDVVTEHFTSAAVFRGNRCSGKTDVCSVRQAVSDNSCSTYNTLGDFFTVLILGHFNLFGQAVLSTVGFVCHNDDISALRKGFVRFLKLLHSRKDNTVSLSTFQPIF